MNTLTQENRCNECKKLFCCSSCRDLHVKNKHPKRKTEGECLLCLSEKLPLKKFENSDYLCHLVIRHLPLMCVLCGQLYRNITDLQMFLNCEFWNRKNLDNVLIRESAVKKLPVQATPSPIVKNSSCPTIYSRQKESWYCNDSDQFHTLQSFTSPPELMRNTSTPMHVGVNGQRFNSQFKTPKVPAFNLKIQKTPTATAAKNLQTNNKSSFVASINVTIDENPSPSLFHSATSQLLVNSKDNINNFDNTPFVSVQNSYSRSSISAGETPSRFNAGSVNRFSEEGAAAAAAAYSRELFRTNSGRTLEVMEEQEEQVSINMDLTEAQDNISPTVSSINIPTIETVVKEAPKRVRFSDQHQYETVAGNTVVQEQTVSDNEEFYEAEETQSVKTIDETNSEADMMKENEDNLDKENLGSHEDSKVFKLPKSASPLNSATAASSRVVMMVVVENGYEITTSNLVPLINSSLQKLERNPLMETNRLEESPSGLVKSVSSVDTYTASSTIDYYSTQSCPDLTNLQNRTETNSSRTNSGDNGSGGILAAVAQAMRYAFRGLPGSSSSPSSSSSSSSSPLKNSSHVGSADDITRSPSSTGSRTNSSNNFSTIATSLLRRPGKRSRDLISDGATAMGYRRAPLRNETSISPAAKRPRSWHRIRGRDPIARMRRDAQTSTLTRGVSSETQHFQQGALSVGDTVLPLPSRAHQSTQTD